MRFNEEQKRKLVRMINDRIFTHNEKFICFWDHQFLNDQYVFKYSDEDYDVDIVLHEHSKFHNDVEIDIHDKKNGYSLIFDTHQYFRKKDVRRLIKSLLNLSSERMIKSNMEVESAEHILNHDEKGNQQQTDTKE